MALSQMQGVQMALCELTILQLLSLKKILFKRYLFFLLGVSVSLWGHMCMNASTHGGQKHWITWS